MSRGAVEHSRAGDAGPDSSPLVAVRDAAMGYGGRAVLSGVDLEVREGDLLVLIGADGSGKSTLLRSLAGLLAPMSGRVERTLPVEKMGFAGSEFDLYPDLTSAENLRFFAALRGVAPGQLASRIDELLALTGLSEARDRRAAQLSGGMRKKLALAVSLAHRPALLLLDEPTVGVDAAARRELWNIVAEANAGGTAVAYTSPYLDEAERARRVVLLDGGRARETGSAELLARASGWRAWVTPAPDRRAVRGLLAQAGLGPYAYLRQEGLAVLARDQSEAQRLIASVLGDDRRPEPARLSVEDAFVILTQTRDA